VSSDRTIGGVLDWRLLAAGIDDPDLSHGKPRKPAASSADGRTQGKGPFNRHQARALTEAARNFFLRAYLHDQST